jgi:ubiquinone/menaquinone biosynthesis C-methylase UbiE
MPTTSEQPTNDLTPDQLMQMGMSFMQSRVLAAAVQLDLFSHLASGHRTAVAMARATGATERGLRMLLDALSGLQLLTKDAGQYQLTPAAAKCLVRSSPEYMGAILESDRLWESWGKLGEAIRSGMPSRRVENQAEAEKFFPLLIRSLHVLNREPARRAAQVPGAGFSGHGLRVLDIACGSGVWGIALAEADPTAAVTMQDFPGVLEHTREFVRRHGIADRCTYLPGDLKTVEIGADRFDVAILGNIIHSEGERSAKDLIRRVHRALRAPGKLAIIETIPNEERTGPPRPLLFALNMLVNTQAGDTYTLSEYTQWLTAAGFSRVETADIGSHSPLVIGVKS